MFSLILLIVQHRENNDVTMNLSHLNKYVGIHISKLENISEHTFENVEDGGR